MYLQVFMYFHLKLLGFRLRLKEIVYVPVFQGYLYESHSLVLVRSHCLSF